MYGDVDRFRPAVWSPSSLPFAGELVGGIFYHNYPGNTRLMNGAVFGKIAGASAAEYVKGR